MIRSENARLTGWVFVDISGRDLGGYVTGGPRYRDQTPFSSRPDMRLNGRDNMNSSLPPGSA